MKSKGLGRGLDALLAAADEGGARESLRTLDIASLQPGKYQPRTHMDQAPLAELASSIEKQGVMQPILARPLAAGKFEIIAGERRWRAAKMAGLAQVPAVVREVPDSAALAMALIENIQRENLNPLEEAHGIQRLISEFDMTHESAADAVGRSRAAVTNLLRLLHLAPQAQELLMQGKIEMGHARALLALAKGKQNDAAALVARKGLSVRETERLVKRLESPAAKKPAARKDRDTLRLQEELSERLGAQVTIVPGKKGAGRMVIDYSSLAELDALVNRFSR